MFACREHQSEWTCKEHVCAPHALGIDFRRGQVIVDTLEQFGVVHHITWHIRPLFVAAYDEPATVPFHVRSNCVQVLVVTPIAELVERSEATRANTEIQMLAQISHGPLKRYLHSYGLCSATVLIIAGFFVH